MLHGLSQALHGGGHAHALAIGVDVGGLIHVHADQLAADLGSRLSRGGVDAAAGGKDNLHAQVGEPVVHVGGDVGVAVELVAVDILHHDLIGNAHLHGSRVSALNKAIAEPLHGGNGHAAQHAQVLVAQLHSGVAGHVAAQLFLVHSAVHVAGQGIALPIGVQITLGHIQRDEGDIGIQFRSLLDGLGKGIAGHHDDVVAIGHSGIHLGHALSGGVAGGLVVLELQALGVAELLAGLVSGLVEGLVGDVAVVGDHGHLIGRVLSGVAALLIGALAIGGVIPAAAGDQGQGHHQCQEQCKKLLHWNLPSFVLLSVGDSHKMAPTGQAHYINTFLRLQPDFQIVFFFATICGIFYGFH